MEGYPPAPQSLLVLLAYPVDAPAPPGQCNCHLPKKGHPDALAYPSHLASLAAPAYPLSFYAALYDPDALAYPGTCLVNGTCHRLLAPNLSPTRSLLPRRRAVGRPCLPYPALPPGNICKAPRARVKHGGRSGLPPASPLPVRRKANVPLMPGPAIPSAHARQEGTHVVRPGRPNLTKSSSCLCLPCTFPPARRFRPCGLWQPSLGGTPQ